MSKPQAMQSYDHLEIGEYSLILNGEQAPEELQQVVSESALTDLLTISAQCPLCKSRLLTEGNFDLSHPDIVYHGKQHYLWYCRNCRFWQLYYYFDEFCPLDQTKSWTGEGCPPVPEQSAYISKMREFEQPLPASFSVELAQYLRSKPVEWNRYEPRQLERLVADLFRANYGGCEVIHVGKPDDGGIDVIFIDSSDGQWLVQVKGRQRQDSSEGVGTIRNLIGAMVLHGTMRGIVVSTADHFTLRARQATARLLGQGIRIDLIDKGVLNRMLEPMLPDRPWLDVVATHDNELARWLSDRIPSDHQLTLFDLH